jgi:hypothetical protein
LDVQIVRHDNVVDDRRQNLIHVTGGRQQPDLLQPLDSIFFSLPLPHTLGFDGRGVLPSLTLILDGLR